MKISNTYTDNSSEQSETSSETIPEADIGARGQDKWKNSAAQADSPFSDFVTLNHFEKIQTDFVEFKRFTHGEILSLKADVANRSPGRKAYTHDTHTDRDREALLRCLQERIISLEKQLQDKQYIIEKLLENSNRSHAENSVHKHAAPSGTERNAQAVKTNKEQSFKNVVDLTKTKDPIQGEQNANPKAKMNNPQQTSQVKTTDNKINAVQKACEKTTGSDGKQVSESEDKAESKRERIYVVGDSIVSGLNEKGLCKRHTVKVRSHPGDT